MNEEIDCQREDTHFEAPKAKIANGIAGGFVEKVFTFLPGQQLPAMVEEHAGFHFEVDQQKDKQKQHYPSCPRLGKRR